ncbi:MAG TPA: hypothetical protein VFJ93_00430 [Gaiellaceae bacterium]|nr:hypothetical protein [Gaiellaceae bacterium]
MTAAEQYVAAAYLVVLVLVLTWVLIVAGKLERLEHALQDLSFVREARTDEPVLEEPTARTASVRAGNGAVEVKMR